MYIPKAVFINTTKLALGYSDVSSQGRCHVLSGSCCHAVCPGTAPYASNNGASRDNSWIFKLKCDNGGRRDYEGDATYADCGGVPYLQVSRCPAANMQANNLL